jgi:hypothetical protein
VRGLSDEPGLAGRGLSSLERTMRALHVKEAYLWPRFQSTVQRDLRPVNVRTCWHLPGTATQHVCTSELRQRLPAAGVALCYTS